MQVNRVNQSNQQTNFGSTYLELAHQWLNARSGQRTSANVVRKAFNKAPIKQGLILKPERLFVRSDYWTDDGKTSLSVVLTERDSAKFAKLKGIARRNFLLRLLAKNVTIEGRLRITPVKDIASIT